MRVAAIAAVLSVLATACAPIGACDDGTCPGELVCHVIRRRCVIDTAPRISLSSPTADSTTLTPTVVVAGRVDEESGAATAEVRVLPGGSWVPLTLANDGAFSQEVALPTLNEAVATLELRASDPSAKSSEYRRQFLVDNSPPRARWAPPRANGRAPMEGGLQFSDPLVDPPQLALDPPAPGGWNPTRDTFQWTLAPNTTYALVSGANELRDASGNAAVEVPLTFTTEPMPPTPGPLAFATGVTDFEAASDPDGVITLAFRYSDRLQWGWFSPRTGKFETLFDGQIGSTTTWYRVDALLPVPSRLPLRTSGLVTRDAGGVFRSSARIDGRAGLEGTAQGGQGALPGVPCDPGGELAAGLLVANAQDAAVFRPPVGPDLPIELSPGLWLAHLSPEHWDLFGFSGIGLKRQPMRCACAPTASCSLGAPELVIDALGGPPSVSTAATGDGRFLLALANRESDRAEACIDCTTLPCSTQLSSRPKAEERRAAAGFAPNQLIAAQKDATAGLQVLERPFSGCLETTENQWRVVATVPGTTSVAATDFRPVMVGPRPGLVYRTQDGQLHLFAAP